MKRIRNFLNLIGNSFIWDPLRGDNGKTQPDELAKWLITWCGIWMAIIEGIYDGQQFTDAKFIAVFTAVVAVAGLQVFKK